MQRLLDLINESRIIYNIESSEIETVLEEMVDKLIDTGGIESEKRDQTTQALVQREQSMSTGIGGGIAIPHCSLEYIDTSLTCLALSRQGIHFNAIDKKPVHIFVTLIMPKNKFQDHIKTLALIAKTLGHRQEKDKLIRAQNFQDIQNALQI